MVWLWWRSPTRGLHPFPEVGHTHTKEEGEQAKGAPQVIQWHSQANSTKAHRTGSQLWVLLSPGPLFPDSLWGGQSPLLSSGPGQLDCLSELTAAEGKCKRNSQARRACRNCLRDLGSHQTISVLAARAGFLCGTSLPSLWLLGSPGSVPGHAVPIRALGPEEIC